MALGLGANATIFQIIDALLLRPFTLRDIDRLTLISETAPHIQLDTQETVAPANYFDWKAQTSDIFDHLAAFEWWDVNFSGPLTSSTRWACSRPSAAPSRPRKQSAATIGA